ncbi:transcription activator [Wolffia australiana]
MAVPMEEAIAALSTFSLEDDQSDLQGLTVLLSAERFATSSPIEYGDVSAYRLSLSEDTKSINQLNTLIQEGKEMASALYTYRSCVKALPQLPESMKHKQTELYMETYQVLDLEMGRLREIQQWQASAVSKLAMDMQRFSRPERLINGPTVTHLWSILKFLDVLFQLDHLKNAKASIPNDFSWYKRTFTQVSVQWQDLDSLREELDNLQIFLSTRWVILLNLHAEMFRSNAVEDILQLLVGFCVDSLEMDYALLFPERHVLLRVLPVLTVLSTSSEKDGESLYKRVKVNRLINIFKNNPVIPAFADLHLSPVAILKELSMYFQNFSSQTRLLALPAPHELSLRDIQEFQRHYLIVNHVEAIRAEHDDFSFRFSAALNQILLVRSVNNPDAEWSREVRGNMYDIIVEGFQTLSRWTGRVWDQCAWKFSRPCKDVPLETEENGSPFLDYEKVVRLNYSEDEKKALLTVIACIKNVGSLLQRSDTIVSDALWETIHAEVQEFVQDKLDTMLRTTFRKKKDLSRILSDMRTLSADWMTNTIKADPETISQLNEPDEGKGDAIHPRSVAPSTAQVHCLQFLICELLSGVNSRKLGLQPGNNGSGINSDDLKELETFFHKLSFFLHILDFTETIGSLTDLGFLWFREFYLENSRVIQFPVECSLPCMLVDHGVTSQDPSLLENILLPLDIYNDAAQQALTTFKQRFLYDEIEAEADISFDQLVFKVSEAIFMYHKCWATRNLLDESFMDTFDYGGNFSTQPLDFSEIYKLRRVKLLGRTIDLRRLITQQLNKFFRENLDILFEHFEAQNLCGVVELQKLLSILELSHQLLSQDLHLDSFALMFNEMQENLSLVSYSSRLSSQIWAEMQNDFLPNFILCNSTRRFVRSGRGASSFNQKHDAQTTKAYFFCGSEEFNRAHKSFSGLYGGFFGIEHMSAIVRLLGPRSLPWLIRAMLDHTSNKITEMVPKVACLQESFPKSIGLLSFDSGISGCQKIIHEQLSLDSTAEINLEVLRGLKEIGSMLYLMSLLDIVLKESDTVQFMQTAPWLGLVPGQEGQIEQIQDTKDSPLIDLVKTATSAIISSKKESPDASYFNSMSRHAEAADLLYRSSINSGNVLEYALAFTSAVLDKHYNRLSATPKTGFMDVTTSKDFYRIYSGLLFDYFERTVQESTRRQEFLGDSVAWGGCCIIYLLGQQQQFELFDFSYQFLNVAEVEGTFITQPPMHSDRGKAPSAIQVKEELLEAMRKARRLNNHVFSTLRARCPLEDKIACAIKQSGAPLQRVKFANAVSSFETLPLKQF